MTEKLENIKACCFDAYGTLFDVASSARQCADDIGENWQDLSNLWRQKQLEYTWLRSLMGDYTDFWHVTGDALDYAMGVCKLNDPLLRSRLMELYLRLQPYPEVEDCLQSLKDRGKKIAILSNGSLTMLTSALRTARLEKYFDQVFSVDKVQIFKTHPNTYAMATETFDLPASEISFHSSNAWDVAGASHFGFQVAWINRFGQLPENLGASAHVELQNLSQLNGVIGD